VSLTATLIIQGLEPAREKGLKGCTPFAGFNNVAICLSS
jgi:hypothetical protein